MENAERADTKAVFNTGNKSIHTTLDHDQGLSKPYSQLENCMSLKPVDLLTGLGLRCGVQSPSRKDDSQIL